MQIDVKNIQHASRINLKALWVRLIETKGLYRFRPIPIHERAQYLRHNGRGDSNNI